MSAWRSGWGVPVSLFVAGMGLAFGGSLWRGGSLGDNSDGGITLAILEHWVRVARGAAADWRSPGWYWPAPHALGYSDSLFLLALPYGLARAAGAGWVAANDIAVATLATAGFWGTALLLRRLGTPVAAGGVAAFVFSFGAVPMFKLGHEQTYTMQLAPVLGLMLVRAWRARSAGWAAGAGLLWSLMLLTAAQTPWFLALEAGLALAAGILLGWRGIDWARGIRLTAGFIAGGAIGAVPFLLLYRDSFGLVRDFAAAHYYSGWPRDLVGVPPGEAMWSTLLHERPGDADHPVAETALGLTPLLAAVGLAGLALAVRWRRWGAAALLVAGLLGPATAVDWGAVEPWWLVFRFVPGGNAVRTPFRIELAAQFFLCLGLGLAMGRAWCRWRVVGRVGLLIIGALLAVEQWGEPPSGRDNASVAWLQTAQRPSFPCTAFYLLPSDGPEPWHQYQSDAMLLSQRLGMPTVNGNSSFYPPGWDMAFTARADYRQWVLDWLDLNGVRGEVCGADPRRHLWVPGVAPLLTGRPASATPSPSG